MKGNLSLFDVDNRTLLVPEDALYLSAEAADAALFGPLFRSTWRMLPATVRGSLLTWWQRLRDTEGQCLRWRGEKQFRIEKVGRGLYKGLKHPAECAGLQNYDWSAVPRIAVEPTLKPAGRRKVAGYCNWDGVELLFLAEILRDYDDEEVRSVVAHELAHAYAAACEDRQPLGASAATWKRYPAGAGDGWEERLVNEMIVAWGFHDTTDPPVLAQRAKTKDLQARLRQEKEWQREGTPESLAKVRKSQLHREMEKDFNLWARKRKRA